MVQRAHYDVLAPFPLPRYRPAMPDAYVPTARKVLPYALSLMCKSCAHLATVDLDGLIAQGRGDAPIRELPFRCSACGGRAFDLMVSGAHLMAGRGAG